MRHLRKVMELTGLQNSWTAECSYSQTCITVMATRQSFWLVFDIFSTTFWWLLVASGQSECGLYVRGGGVNCRKVGNMVLDNSATLVLVFWLAGLKGSHHKVVKNSSKTLSGGHGVTRLTSCHLFIYLFLLLLLLLFLFIFFYGGTRRRQEDWGGQGDWESFQSIKVKRMRVRKKEGNQVRGRIFFFPFSWSGHCFESRVAAFLFVFLAKSGADTVSFNEKSVWNLGIYQEHRQPWKCIDSLGKSHHCAANFIHNLANMRLW